MLSKIWFIRVHDHKYYYKKELVDFNKSVNKRNCKKSNFDLWEKDEIVF